MASVKTVLANIGHVAAWPFEHGAQLMKTLEDALRDEPKVRAAVLGLIQQISLVTADGAIVVSSKGIDLAADAAALVAAKQLFLYVENTFLPEVKTVYTDISPDVEGLIAAAPVAAPVGAPGLHNVVPA
jgi:hypothetical protein